MLERLRPRRLVLVGLVLAAVLTAGTTACKPRSSPQNWRYNTVYQAHSSATFGVHHTVRYRHNGRRIEVLENRCAADNWYSSLRYTGRCTATPRNGRLEVNWGWVWAKTHPKSQSYNCRYEVSRTGRITRKKPDSFWALPCKRFDP